MRSKTQSLRLAGWCLSALLLLGAAPTLPAPAHAAAAGDPPAPAVPPTTASAAPKTFAPLDLPDLVVVHTPSLPKDQPWILVVDDAQCPYCMQFLLALEKLRETNDPEVSRAHVVTIPYPLPYHDQSAHIVADAFCLQRSGASRGWTAATYLDWLIVDPWKDEPAWKTATIEDLEKDGGLFDARYDAHRVTSSRRREFQTRAARTESEAMKDDCPPGFCRGDAACEKLCADRAACRTACPAVPLGADAAAREKCLADCASSFVSKRYRLDSKSHSACLLEDGPGSVHAQVAGAFAWAIAHKIPGTPTIYAGHPSIGFRELGDSDKLSESLALLRDALAETRGKLHASGSGPGSSPRNGPGSGSGSRP